MSINITQTCDGCGRDRTISTTLYGAIEEGGWRIIEGREVPKNTHLCPRCIQDMHSYILSPKPNVVMNSDSIQNVTTALTKAMRSVDRRAQELRREGIQD